DGRQVVENVNLALPRGGVIAGSVIDEFGDPLPNVSMTAMQAIYRDGRRSLVAAATPETTDDRGSYRLSGLAPGSYYIHARKTLTGLAAGMVVNSSLFFPLVYAPGVPFVGDARRVTVGLAQTVSGVDVTMLRVPMASISGSFVDADGQPVRDGFVRLTKPGQ